MRIHGRLESYENIPCEVLCFPPAIPYYFAIEHIKALSKSTKEDYWAHIGFIASELIPILNFIPLAIEYFAGKKEKEVSFEIGLPSVVGVGVKPKVDRNNRKSINLQDNITAKLFTSFIFGGKEKEAIEYFTNNAEKLRETINIPCSLGLINNGNTVLHYAAYMHMNALIRLLVEEEANIKATNDENKTPRDCYEFEGGDPETVLGQFEKTLFSSERTRINNDELIEILALLTPPEEPPEPKES